MRISGLSGGLGPGCLGFLGTVAGGARWQAPKPDLHSILRANFPPTPDAPPMPSTDTRESRGKQKRGWEGAWKGLGWRGLEVEAAQIGAAVSLLVMLLTKRSPLPLIHDWLRLPY